MPLGLDAPIESRTSSRTISVRRGEDGEGGWAGAFSEKSPVATGDPALGGNRPVGISRRRPKRDLLATSALEGQRRRTAKRQQVGQRRVPEQRIGMTDVEDSVVTAPRTSVTSIRKVLIRARRSCVVTTAPVCAKLGIKSKSQRTMRIAAAAGGTASVVDSRRGERAG